MDPKARTGTVVHKEGAFFLEVEGKHHPIPVGSHIKLDQLRELAGQKVEIIQSEPLRFVVGLVPAAAKTGPRIPRIICYIPADPYVFGVVEEEARVGLAKQFLDQGVLSKENYEKLGG